MVDAAIAAIAEATGVDGTVLDFKVSSVTGGGDAFGDVVIQLDVDGLKAIGPRRLDRRRRGVGPRPTSTRSTRSCACASGPRCATSRSGRERRRR